MHDERVTTWLHRIYQTIATPVATIELTAGADATGMSVQYGRRRWVEVRDNHQLHKQYKKLHICSGTQTNIIYAARVTAGQASENPQLKFLLADIKNKFSFREFSADAGYLSRNNVDLVASHGMLPFIMPKKNTISLNKGSQGAWGKMIWFWKQHPDLFKMHYHRRSLVEGTFSMLKRKFGYEVRSKSLPGQTNEILCKIVCLNAAILGEALLTYDLNPAFMNG